MSEATSASGTAGRSRQIILDRLRTIPIAAGELPSIDQTVLVRYDDPAAKFAEMVEAVGGHCHRVTSADQVGEVLRGLPEFTASRHTASLVPEAVVGDYHWEQIDDPHAMATLDWAIVRGEFGVAENGAIWVRPQGPICRAMLFLTQHLAVVVREDAIAMHMHEAYVRVRAAREAASSDTAGDFGVFISGPSKTADIEQSLVIGAHGCRTFHAFLVP